MSGFLLAAAVLSVVLAIGLRREYARLERERRMAAVMGGPAMRKLARDLHEFKWQVGEQLVPVMVQFAANVQPFMDAMSKAARQIEAMRPKPRFYWLFRRLHWLPDPAYYWLLDRLTDNNGWRPLFYREDHR